MIYFISGHRDLSQEDFKKYYVNKILEVINEDPDPEFVVGDYEGVDYMAQEWLVNVGLQEKLTVYHMWSKPRHLASGVIHTKGGYKSDLSRDSAMTEDSDFDIAYVAKPGKSGTRCNILRRWTIKRN